MPASLQEERGGGWRFEGYLKSDKHGIEEFIFLGGKGLRMIKKQDIEYEIVFLQRYLNRTSDELNELKMKIPEGCKLSSIKHGNVYQYYKKEAGMNGNGIYIKRENMDMAKKLAQIEYDEKLIVELQKSIVSLERLEAKWLDDPFEVTLNKMISGKRVLVNCPFISDDLYISNWKSQKYEGLSFKEGYPEYYTRRGLRVRSKSEVIIADILDEMSIPFHYEKPLLLNNIFVHPDFTILNIKERREIYWEHFGMMDDMDYRNNAFNKIRNYESNGFYQYDSLICTFETGKYPMNTKDIRNMIKALCKSLGYHRV